MTKLNELQEQIKLLNLENDSLVERVEEIEIIALISKQFEDADTEKEIYQIVLERISIMKTIPYCAVFKIEDDKPLLETEYSYLSNDADLVKSFSFPEDILKEISEGKTVFFDSQMERFDNFKMKFFDKYLIPDCYLIIPFDIQNRQKFFLFANHCKEHDITIYKSFLEQVISLAKNKVTNIKLIEYIINQNNNLEQIVEEKSEELYESEAKYRELIEQLPDAVLVHHKGIIEYLNPATIKQKIYYCNVNKKISSKLQKLDNWVNIIDFIDMQKYYATMGIDRICAVEAVENGVIIEAGSAITVDVVKDTYFEGGFIYPGVKSMQKTYKNISPALDYSFNFDLELDIMPKNSQDAISYGYLKTLYSEVISYDMPIILTGGFAKEFKKIFKNAQVNENLIFDGMKHIIKKANIC